MQINIKNHKGINNFSYTFNFTETNAYLIYGRNGAGKTSLLTHLEKIKNKEYKFECVHSFKNRNLEFGINLINDKNNKINCLLKNIDEIANTIPEYKNLNIDPLEKNYSYEKLIIESLKLKKETKFMESFDFNFLVKFNDLFFVKNNISEVEFDEVLKTIEPYEKIKIKYNTKLTKTEREKFNENLDIYKKAGVISEDSDEMKVDVAGYFNEVENLLETKKIFKKKDILIFFEENINKFSFKDNQFNKIKSMFIYFIVLKNIKKFKQIEKLIKKYKLIISEKENILKEWTDVKNEYESIFINSPLKFDLLQDKDGIYDIFFKVSNRYKKYTSKDILEVLSTSEQRSLYLLNIMYKISLINPKDEKIILVFDDVVDTFDEINQSAIAYYLDTLEKKKYKFIVLTHNYSFLKILRNKLHLRQTLILSNNLNKTKIEIFHENTDYIFNTWFDKDNIMKKKYLIALSSVFRELGHIDKKYPKDELLNFFHIKKNTNELLWCDYIETVKDNLNLDEDSIKEIKKISTTYLEEVKNVCIKICSDETDHVSLSESIANKICLAIGIRLFLELHMIKYLGFDCLNKIKDKQTKKLIDQIRKNDLFIKKPKITSILAKYDIASSNIIHLNSFNYEVLFYYNIEYLKKLYLDISKKESIECLE